LNDLLLTTHDLNTHFFTDDGVIKAVNGVDLTIRNGETLGLVGESGCGKSVTAMSIMRLIPEPPGRIVKGRIVFDGRDLLALSDDDMCRIRGNRISMIFQEPMTSLNPVYPVGTQVAETLRIHKGLNRRAALFQAVEMLNKVGIPDPARRTHDYPHQMSGGMRQRVMIAMALTCNPQLLIADEPTTALDVSIQSQILDLMNDLKVEFGAAVLLITHDLGVVSQIAQWVAVMYAGRIVEYAAMSDLFAAPGHPYTEGLMQSIPNMNAPVPSDKQLPVIPGMVPSLLHLPDGCAFQSRCRYAIDRCRQQEPPLFEPVSGHLIRCWRHE